MTITTSFLATAGQTAAMPRCFLITLLLCTCIIAAARGQTEAETAPGPQPGDVYREYPITMDEGATWRVTDPAASHEMAQEFLPNPVLHFAIDDLSGAVRAEVIIDRWGGHPGTTGQRLRFNGNPWIALPLLRTTPEGSSPECYVYQDNPVIQVPLEHLLEGENTLEGTSGGQTCYDFGWGQWGWYGALVRIYYSEDKEHPVATITNPASGEVLSESPTIGVRANLSLWGRGVKQIDLVARYEGYDEDGDGVFVDWHRHLHYDRMSGQLGSISGPTIQSQPYHVRWDTRYVPDQPAGTVSLVARIQDYRDVWSVSEPVDGLSLLREASRMQMYRAEGVSERFWVRQSRERARCTIEIPLDAPFDQIQEATLHLRTWNGYNHGDSTIVRINGHRIQLPGVNHNYAYVVHPVDGNILQPGKNVVEFESTTEHHGVEILWPGPALIVRYEK